MPPRFMRWSRKRALRIPKSSSPAPLRVVSRKWHLSQPTRAIGTRLRGLRPERPTSHRRETTHRRDEAFLTGCSARIDGPQGLLPALSIYEYTAQLDPPAACSFDCWYYGTNAEKWRISGI